MIFLSLRLFFDDEGNSVNRAINWYIYIIYDFFLLAHKPLLEPTLWFRTSDVHWKKACFDGDFSYGVKNNIKI